MNTKPGHLLYEFTLPDEDGLDYGILVDLPSEIPSLGIDQVVTKWAWFPLHEENDWWQIKAVRQALSGKEKSKTKGNMDR